MLSTKMALLSILITALVAVACAAPAVPTATPPPKSAPAPIATIAPATPATKAVATPVAVKPTPPPQAAAPKPKTLMKVKVAYTAVSGNYVPVWIAKQEKLFEKYGLDVDLTFISSTTTAIQALIAGEVPIVHGSAVPMIAASLGGNDAQIVASLFNTVLNYLMVHPSVNGPADLKGKTLGMSRFGSLTDIALRYAVRKLGLDPEKDVTIVQVGGPPEILAAMKTGAVVGGTLSAPTNVVARKEGFKVLLDIAKAGMQYPGTTIGTTRKFMQSNGPEVENFLRAIVEGTYIFKTNKDLSMRVIKEYTKIEDPEALEDTWRSYSETVEKIPYPTREAMEVAIEEVAVTNPKAKGASPDAFMDLQFMKRLESSGFIKQIYKE
ncbi:MAG: ABC transporter substrate-binding protein [Chloroflexi bacterium]|nr:ABC transporter substrate-binding protein [Chloroflexota bacterium]